MMRDDIPHPIRLPTTAATQEIRKPELSPSARPLLVQLFQFLCSLIDRVGIAFQRVRCPRHFGFGLGVLLLLDALADSRQRLGAVAGVETGRINQMPVPWSTGQTLRADQLPLGLK